MDVASPDETTRHHALRHLHICVVSLRALSIAWLWSKRALRAFRFLANEWLLPHAVPHGLEHKALEAEDPVLSPSIPSHVGQQGSELLTEVSAETPGTTPRSTWPAEQPLGSELQHADVDFGTPRSFNPIELQDIDWLFCVESAVDRSRPLSDEFEASDQMDTWLSSALQEPFSSFAWIDME